LGWEEPVRADGLERLKRVDIGYTLIVEILFYVEVFHCLGVFRKMVFR